jgi:predicted amidophosphoribosyltransferase
VFPLDALVRHCKYQSALELTEFFAQALADRIQLRQLSPPDRGLAPLLGA